MARLAEADFRSALQVLEVAEGVSGADPFPPKVLEQLRQLVGADWVTYRDTDLTGSPRAEVAGVPENELRENWRRYPRWRHQDPIPSADASITGRALRLSDFLTRPKFHDLGLYAAVCHPVGTEYILKLRLPATDGIECGFVFESKDRDFTQRDVAVLQLLYPHLLQLRRNAAVRRREARLRGALERELEAAEDCGPLEQLTTREREVLSWVARGKTNVEVADLLGMAPATVRKHLEHIYEKLGVTTRTAAAIRALGV